jgi:DNA-directed RNA polymerase delta subunit
LVSEPELVEKFLKELKTLSSEPKVNQFAEKWLSLSKSLAKNPLGEWGLASSPNIRMRGIRDYAYLVLRKAQKPLHFSEVAKQIQKTFGREAHPATCHNELIKDNRFVLVGRGLYALTEWGYSKGTVIEVIQKLIKERGPLSRQEVVDEVTKQRQVKLNTIIVNLQNPKYFKRQGDGHFSLAK